MKRSTAFLACALSSQFCITTSAAGASRGAAPVDYQGMRAPVAALEYNAPSSLLEGRGLAAWEAIGPFGGDIDAVRQSPTNPNIVLAGLAPGGSSGGALFRSTDGGNTWSRVTSMNRSVYDITFTPAGRVLIGTDDGVWSSVDNGVSWTANPLGIGLNDTVHRVVVDPTNSNVIWAGVNDHLGAQLNNVMRSADGGATWQNRTPPLGGAAACRGIAIDPANASNVYVCFGGGLGGGQFWFSSNGGTSWVNRSAGLPARPMNDVVHDGTRVLVGGGQQFGSQTFGLFATTNHGVTWTPLHAGWPNLFATDIEVDPANAARLYVTTLSGGLFRSLDGGSTWTFAVGGTSGMSLNAVALTNSSPEHLIIGGSSVAVLQSDKGGSFVATSMGIDALDVFSISASQLTGELAIAFQGLNNGGAYTSDDGGQTWQLEPLPGTRFSVVEFAPDGTLYALSTGPTTVAAEGVYRRNPGTGAWSLLGPNQGPQFETELFSIEFSQTNPNLIVAGGNDFGAAGFEQTVWLSTTAGGSWTKVFEGLANRRTTDLHVVTDGTDQVMVGSTSDLSGGNAGGALRSTNGGSTWGTSNDGLPVTFGGTGLSASAADPATLFLSNSLIPGGSGNRGLYRSTDGGGSWTAHNGITVVLNGVASDSEDDQILYGMNNAQLAIRSLDRGASFELFNDGLGSGLFPRDMALDGAGSRLLLATNRGSYVRSLGLIGDMNCDGLVTVADIGAFVLALTDPAGYAAAFPDCNINNGDINNDGIVSVSDIGPFVALVTGG